MKPPRRARRGRPPKMKRPDQYERAYQRELRGLVADLAKSVRAQIISILPELIQDREAQVRADTWVDTIERAVTTISFGMEGSRRAAERASVNIAGDVADFNQQSWRAVVRSAVGVDAFKRETWLADELRGFAAENAKLIQSLSSQSLDKIQGIVQRGVRSGISARDLSKDIQAQLGMARRRADLIARDQVASLNGQITKLRQQATGIKTYYWSTSGDERVRQSHSALDGMLCRWDDDTVFSSDDGETWRSRSSIGADNGHPGEPIQCRCSSIANTDELLRELLGD